MSNESVLREAVIRLENWAPYVARSRIIYDGGGKFLGIDIVLHSPSGDIDRMMTTRGMAAWKLRTELEHCGFPVVIEYDRSVGVIRLR